MTFIEEQIIDNIKYSKWRPDYSTNDKILKENNIKTNAEYRKFMINNATSIIQMNGVIDRSYCSSVDTYNNVPTSKTPYIYTTNDKTYAYSNSDLKNDYMDKYEEKCHLRASSF